MSSSSTSLAATTAANNNSDPPPKQYLLHYDYIPNVLEKREPYREGHLNLAKDMIAHGTCVSGGPVVEAGGGAPTGALLIFTTEQAVQDFVQGDPYIAGGIVTRHSIQEWTVVVQAKES